jgi:uncharacterized membrane protein
MFGLTSLGTVHTAISIVAVVAAIVSLVRFGEIRASHTLGKTYVWATVLTCLTGFGIFQHGGFGKPHALGIITLVVLAVAALAGRRKLGGLSRYIEAVAYSTTVFFHTIPGLTETFTRVPVGAPLFSGPDDPSLQKAVGVCFVLLVIGCVLQVRKLRAGKQSGTLPLGGSVR